MPRMVRYERFGGPDVLEVVEVEAPLPGPGQLRVHVQAAGLNPVDAKIFEGTPAAERFGAVPPCGVGHDFAGVVDELGEGVEGFRVGDPVFGGARNRALADYVVADADGILLPTPEGLRVEQAGCLAIAGLTAAGAVAAVDPRPGETVLVSAAAGGVGVLASQLAVRAGATVLGTCGEHNDDFLRSIGVVPVRYGHGLLDRVRELAPGGVDAVLDFHGMDTILLALELEVPRINSVASRDFAEHGVTSAGRTEASLADLARIAGLVASGELVLPIEAVYPLQRVAEAYERLATGHLRGKIVVVTD